MSIRLEAFVREFRDEIGPEGVQAGLTNYTVADLASMAREMGFLVAEEGGAPVGFCVVEVKSETTAEIAMLYVGRHSAGRGVGRQLVSAAEQWVKDRYPWVSFLIAESCTPKYNGGFYEKLGFRKVSDVMLPFPTILLRGVRYGRRVAVEDSQRYHPAMAVAAA